MVGFDGATPLDPDELNGLKFKHIETLGACPRTEIVVKEGWFECYFSLI